MSALASPEVGRYLNRHFVSAFQKVAAFQAIGQVKVGGNVASYFCTPDGLVLHAIAGPVDGRAFLHETRWVNETYNLAVLEKQTAPDPLRVFFRKAHQDRLQLEHRVHLPLDAPPPANPAARSLGELLDQNRHLGLTNEGKVHLLFAVAPLPRIEQVYQVVFEKILNEKVTTNPVRAAGR